MKKHNYPSVIVMLDVMKFVTCIDRLVVLLSSFCHLNLRLRVSTCMEFRFGV